MTESLLRSGPQAMSELARPFGISLPGAKKHIAVLEAAGLVSCAKKGRENICSVNPAALQSAAEWFAFQSKFWNASFDRLEKLLQRR